MYHQTVTIQNFYPGDTQRSAPNQEPVVVNQEPVAVNSNPAHSVDAGDLVVGNVQSPALPQAQAMIQGPNQVAFDHEQPAPPVVVAAALTDVLNVTLPNPIQPPVPAPGLALAPMAIPPAANGNPIHLSLKRTLYGFPDIPIEEQHSESEDVQGDVSTIEEETYCSQVALESEDDGA
ncbi:hypothetical protein FRC09_005500 [Ceratobasidium sp. 395]|nr:hypothetical protein FRC09_005500 [Ceratobasidium sp. 395]